MKPAPAPDPELLGTYDIARLCKVVPSTVVYWINTGKLEAQHTPGGHRRVTRSALAEFLKRSGLEIPAELFSRRRILIVEDELDVQRLLKRVLGKIPGVSLEVVTGGVDALVSIGKRVPDLIILDLYIPQIKGFEVCRALRMSQSTRDIQIIAISGKPLTDSERRVLQRNCNAFFRKPIDFEALTKCVAKLLNLQPAQRD